MSAPVRPAGRHGTLRVGTRASALARTQTAQVLDALGLDALGDLDVEVVPIVTDGDRSPAALAQLGGTGVFVSALRTALTTGEIDIAVHSYKDLPIGPADGVVVAAVPVREDPRDALVARDGLGLALLPAGARVGTGSPRRAAQLRALGLGLDVVPVRGNVDTRLGKVRSGELDAVVLAVAGLRRLGLAGEVSEVLDPLQMLPAPAQGALAVECRADDVTLAQQIAGIDDPDTRAAVTAERAVLAGLQAGCSAPVGALAEVALAEPGAGGLEIFLRSCVTAIDGQSSVRLSATGPTTDAEGIGRRLAAAMISDGADQMMGSSS